MAQPDKAPPRKTLMRWIVGTSLNYRFLVVAIGALLMVFGVATLPSTRVDAFPEFAPPRVVIQTACLGLSTSDVEQLVTVPLEQALNGVEGLDDMRSKSVPQLSAIELIFKQGFNELKARQLVQERMNQVATTLPTWAAPPVMLAPVSATGRAIQIGMTSKDHSLIQMSMSAYWTIRARLLEVPGVANVALWGERLQQMQVQVEPPKMEAQHVALNEVMEATADAVDSGLLRFSSGSIIGTGGMVESPNQRIPVRNVLPIITPDDLAKVPLHADSNRAISTAPYQLSRRFIDSSRLRSQNGTPLQRMRSSRPYRRSSCHPRYRSTGTPGGPTTCGQKCIPRPPRAAGTSRCHWLRGQKSVPRRGRAFASSACLSSKRGRCCLAVARRAGRRSRSPASRRYNGPGRLAAPVPDNQP